MNSTAAVLDRVVSDLDVSIESAVRSAGLDGMSDAEKLDVLRLAGEAQRRLDALVVETCATVDGRLAGSGVPTFPAVFGCRNMNELLQRVLRVDATGASRVVKAAGAVHREVEITTGARLPARWPALREAMLDGVIGIAGLLAAIDPIDRTRGRISGQDQLQADTALADCARGIDGAKWERPSTRTGPNRRTSPTVRAWTVRAWTGRMTRRTRPRRTRPRARTRLRRGRRPRRMTCGSTRS